jgi:hypothetical protein
MNINESVPFHPHFNQDNMPLDRLIMATNFQIRAEVTAANPEHIKAIRLPKAEATSTNKYKQQKTIPVELHGGVRLLIADCGGKGLWLRRVEFNPGRLFNGHNGNLLTTAQVVTAFALLCQKIEPLLVDAEDAFRLIPGCPDSPSYWLSVEIAMHLCDPDGGLLSSLRNATHTAIRKKATVYEGESITLGTRRSELMINIYRKDIEMARTLEEFGVMEGAEILKIEVTLRKDKLLSLLGTPGNTTKLSSVYAGDNGTASLRVVRFRAAEVIASHKKIVRELRGIAKAIIKGDLPGNERPGRMLGLVAVRTGTPLEELLNVVRMRFGLPPITVTRMRAAALNEISLSDGPTVNLFDDERYLNQPIISIPQLERAGVPDDYPSKFRPMIEANYATRPASSQKSPRG